MSRSRSRNTETNGGVPTGAMEKLREEDGALEGDRDAALAKLTGSANGHVRAPVTSEAVLNGGTKEPAINGVASQAPANGLANPAVNGIATESHLNHTAVVPAANDSVREPISAGATSETLANGSAEVHFANSTAFVQSLMNGSIDGKPTSSRTSAEVKDVAKEANGTANGHPIEA